jgi:RNA polymerase sigma-70 factor (ECF subfamily)
MNQVGTTPEFDAGVTRFRSALRGFIRKRVPNDSLADDLTQEVWVRIARKLGDLRDAQKLEGWIYQIARNVVTDFFRRQRETSELPADLAAPPDDSSIEELRQGLYDYVKGVVHTLPEPHRTALELTMYGGLSQEELAGRLGITLTAAKSRVQRARAEVRKTMERCCRWEFDKLGNIIDYEPRPGGCRGCQ